MRFPDDIPLEILKLIFSFLTGKDLLNMRYVGSRKLREIASEENLWQTSKMVNEFDKTPSLLKWGEFLFDLFNKFSITKDLPKFRYIYYLCTWLKENERLKSVIGRFFDQALTENYQFHQPIKTLKEEMLKELFEDFFPSTILGEVRLLYRDFMKGNAYGVGGINNFGAVCNIKELEPTWKWKYYLCEEIKHLSKEKEMYFSSIRGSGGRSMRANFLFVKLLAQVLRENYENINSIKFGNSHEKEWFVAIAEALSLNKKVTSVFLHTSTIGIEGTKAIAKALVNNNTITSLRIDCCDIGGNEGMEAIAEAIKLNKTLTSINMFQNLNIGNRGRIAMAKSIASLRFFGQRKIEVILDDHGFSDFEKHVSVELGNLKLMKKT